MNPWEINADHVLVVPDVHQNVEWAKAIISHENGNYTHIVFLGDFVDTHIQPPPSSVEATARFFAEIIEREDTTVLLGNHDAPRFECWSFNQHFKTKRPLIHACSGFTNSSSQQFNRIVTLDHWKRTQLFTLANGWLLSHAGVHPSFWRGHLGMEQNLGGLWRDAKMALDLLPFQMSPLLECGVVRGGTAEYGGIIWSDWEFDFQDRKDAWPKQLVGHTCDGKIRRIGRSYCIDTGQKTYAVISRDSSITFKSLDKINGEWQARIVEESEIKVLREE